MILRKKMDCVLFGLLLVIGALAIVLISVSWETFKMPKRPCKEQPQCTLHSYSILDNGWKCKDAEGPCRLNRFCVVMHGCKGGSNLGCWDEKGPCVSAI